MYLGRRKLDIRKGELIREIAMPRRWLGNYYLHKVGARKSLAIARLSFAGLFAAEDGIVAHNAVAVGAISDMIIRLKELDEMIVGLSIEEAKRAVPAVLDQYSKAISPTQGRVSSEYRKEACLSLLKDYYETMLRREAERH
jgi:CO/xanthine dehydrogenase FAD-binding subunit